MIILTHSVILCYHSLYTCQKIGKCSFLMLVYRNWTKKTVSNLRAQSLSLRIWKKIWLFKNVKKKFFNSNQTFQCFLGQEFNTNNSVFLDWFVEKWKSITIPFKIIKWYILCVPLYHKTKLTLCFQYYYNIIFVGWFISNMSFWRYFLPTLSEGE